MEFTIDGEHTIIIDDEDFNWISSYSWRLSKSGYVVRSAPTKPIRWDDVALHRLLVPNANDLFVDHKNGDKLDNRKVNLRTATREQNIANTSKAWGKSDYRGVSWHKGENRWHSRISYYGQRIWIGSFATELEAAKAYNDKAVELWDDFAGLNPV